MSDVTKRLATDQSLQGTNTAIGATNTALGLLAKDATLQATNTALGGLGNVTQDTTLAATNTAIGATNTALGLLAKDATLTATNTALAATNTALETLLNGLIGVLASVKSVNGQSGVVVLDSGDILIDQTLVSSKTVQEMLSEMETAISQTPLSFSTSQISGNDYLLTVTQGTPG